MSWKNPQKMTETLNLTLNLNQAPERQTHKESVSIANNGRLFLSSVTENVFLISRESVFAVQGAFGPAQQIS